MPITELTPPWPLFAAFVAASFLLAVTPGPGVLYIVTRSLTHGRRLGLASVAGVALGNLGNAVGAAVGVAALFTISSAAFSVVKYAGAAYLVFLGLQTLLRSSTDSPSVHRRAAASYVFRDGFFVALLNPKTTIFFAAFLPQFMAPTASPVGQSILLGTLFVLIAAVTDSAYAIGAGAFANYLANVRRVRTAGRLLSGGVFIGLGVFAALSETRNAN